MKCPFCKSERSGALETYEDRTIYMCGECGETYDDEDAVYSFDGDDQEPDSSGDFDGYDYDPEFERFLIDNGLIHDPDGDVIDI